MTERQVDDRVPALSIDDRIGEQIYNALQHDRYKEKINAMIIAHTKTVDFQELVMKYASKEYDNRLLKSGRFWSATVIAAIVTAAISAIVTVWITSLAK